VAAIVTVPKPPARPTANLLAPLVMGKNSRVGVQIVLHESTYEVRHEL
jgi:flagellar assembly factor FliW